MLFRSNPYISRDDDIAWILRGKSKRMLPTLEIYGFYVLRSRTAVKYTVNMCTEIRSLQILVFLPVRLQFVISCHKVVLWKLRNRESGKSHKPPQTFHPISERHPRISGGKLQAWPESCLPQIRGWRSLIGWNVCGGL